ncbi:MAG: hypothetical protein M0Z36_14850, partial [Thermaerobacter sp.]|nr:hypothetical protein [Thermaerobacter sp.]
YRRGRKERLRHPGALKVMRYISRRVRFIKATQVKTDPYALINRLEDFEAYGRPQFRLPHEDTGKRRERVHAGI